MVTDEQFMEAAKLIGCEFEVIKAVALVEASGEAYLQNGDLKILFEPHIFWRELKSEGYDPNKFLPKNSDILYEKWGAKPYGKFSEQWPKLKRAIGIDETAALKSASYGMFQILGNNYVRCGYTDVQDFVDDMCASEELQLKAFVKFIISLGLDKFLIKKDFTQFSRGYNGSGFAKNKYDIKIAAAYAGFKNKN